MKKNINFVSLISKRLLVLSFTIGLISCENDPICESENFVDSKLLTINKYKISEEEAKENLLNFLNASKISTYGNASTRMIKSFEPILTKKQSVSTYATENSLFIDIDTLMYLINFENDEGFAFVSADKRTDAIFAIIDQGNLSVDSLNKVDNPGFNSFIEKAIIKGINDINNYDESWDIQQNVYTYGGNYVLAPQFWYSADMVTPKLKTKWGQGESYNIYCPGRYPTGCVMTATAQILSYFQVINSIQYYDNGSYYSIPLNWSQIMFCSEREFGMLVYNHSPAASQQVAHLMRYLGLTLDAEYSSSVTYAFIEDALTWMRNNGLSSTTDLIDFDSETMFSALKNGKLIFARGQTGQGAAHAWVIDGGHKYLLKDNRILIYAHCNWGFDGLCDGYYLGNVFDTSVDKRWERENGIDVVDGTRNSNYNYYQKISIVGM